jgi:hypothetical protein
MVGSGKENPGTADVKVTEAGRTNKKPGCEEHRLYVWGTSWMFEVSHVNLETI